MKIIIGFLVVAVLLLAGAVVWLAVPEPLTASEVARGIGMHHWRFRVPDTYQPSQIVGLEITTPDGVQPTGGGGAGFQPGEILKLFITPIGDGSQFRLSVFGKQGNFSSTLDNPCKGLSITAHLPDGSLLKDGIVMIGSNGSVSLQQPKASDTIVRIKVLDPAR